MTVQEESIYESFESTNKISPKSITSIKSLKRSPRNGSINGGGSDGRSEHCKYEGWLRVFEGLTLNDKDENGEWHNGFIVCRSDEQSLICYPTEGTAKTFARFLPSIRLDDPIPLETFQLPTASNYSSPINAYEQLPPRPPSRKKSSGILPGLSATIDRVTERKRNRNMSSSSISNYGNYATRSATVSRYYGSEITVLESQQQQKSSTIRSKSAKTFAQKFYYSTLRTIRGWFKIFKNYYFILFLFGQK